MWTEIWNNLFVIGAPLLEKIIRPVIVYLFLVIGLRLAGKRELASLNPFDLVVLLTISNTVQNAIIGNDNSVLGGIVGAVTLLIVNFVVLRTMYRNPRLDKVLEGDAEVLIAHGKIDEKALHREMITHRELEIAANKQGFESLEHIEQAEIEPSGSIFFVEKDPSPQEKRFREILTRLDRIEQSLNNLQKE
jgi:uncharacterized membrane protein YcaP (DUF421 family)